MSNGSIFIVIGMVINLFVVIAILPWRGPDGVWSEPLVNQFINKLKRRNNGKR